MGDPLHYPKLRWPLDIRMERLETEEAIVISCPLGISSRPLVLKAAVGPILAQFEGRLSIDEVTEHFKQFGIHKALITELVRLLDDNLFLASPRFFSAESETRTNFAQATVRPAALAGLGYSSQPGALAHEIDELLAPHKISASVRSRAEARSLVTLVAPHIDYRRGGLGYGVTYKNLLDEAHDLYVLIGTSHQYSKGLFHLTLKDFDSPLGIFPCDRDFCNALVTRYGFDRALRDEFLHRREHSLELQLPFMQRTVGNKRIVPILVGSFHHMLQAGKQPREYDEYESFAGALAEGLQEFRSSGKRICFIAGVDMAHVGMNFGDKHPLSQEFMERVESRDREYLDALRNGSKQQLYAHVAEDMDARRICGFPTLYTVLDVLDRIGLRYRAEVFDYRQAVDYRTDCAVTFAGVGFYVEP